MWSGTPTAPMVWPLPMVCDFHHHLEATGSLSAVCSLATLIRLPVHRCGLLPHEHQLHNELRRIFHHDITIVLGDMNTTLGPDRTGLEHIGPPI